MSTRTLAATDDVVSIHGAVSLESTPRGVQPWRIDHRRIKLFEPALLNRGMDAAGVRVALLSNTTVLGLEVDPCFELKSAEDEPNWSFDLLVDGALHQRVEAPRTTRHIRFGDIPDGTHRLEVYLPLGSPVAVKGVVIDADASVRAFEYTRPRWVVYGSSITQCRSAAGPAESWPALVARQFDLHLTCMGYGGNCHLEPIVARTIRDLPADYISLCLGINVMGGGSYNGRTFRAAVIGTILTIRDGHPDTPMVVVSPLCNPPRENAPNTADMTLVRMRQLIRDAVETITSYGDQHLHYVDGLELYGPAFVRYMPDELHPDAEGYRLLAQRYGELVMPHLGLERTMSVA